MEPTSLVPVLTALEFAAFGWRINREIGVGDKGLRTWLPFPDLLNIAALLAVVATAVVLPLANRGSGRLASVVVAVAWTLIALHPLNVAAHYRLFSHEGRGKYTRLNRDIPYVTDQEGVTLGISAVLSIGAALFVWN